MRNEDHNDFSPGPPAQEAAIRLPYRDVLSSLSWRRLEFVHRLPYQQLWPSFMGPQWRGAFGHALRAVDPSAAMAMYGPGSAIAPLAHWALLPPLASTQWMPENTCVSWSLTLFGEAQALAHPCMAAAERMQAAFDALAGNSAQLPLVDARLTKVSNAIDVFDAAAAGVADASSGRYPGSSWRLGLETPWDLGKQEPRPHASAPPHSWLTLARVHKAVLGSLWKLTGKKLDLPTELRELLQANSSAATLSIDGDLAHVMQVTRSSRGSTASPHEVLCAGWTGWVIYEGFEASWMTPWMAVAQAMQLGRRRHYGQGVVSWYRLPRQAQQALGR